MEQRAIGDRPGKVRRKAAARRIDVVDACDAALVVEADLVVDQEIVPLAGRGHVVVAVGPDLDGAAELLGGDRRDRRELVDLRLLAAEAAAHAPDLDRHRMRGNAERMRHHVLHLARMLGRGIDGDVLVLAGNGKGDLAFEIEMLLAADPHPALQPVRRRGDRRGRVAALQRQWRRHQPAVDRIEPGNVDDGRQFLVFDLGQPAGAPRLFARLGDDGRRSAGRRTRPCRRRAPARRDGRSG